MMFNSSGMLVFPGEDRYQGRKRRTKWEYPYSYDPFTVWGHADKSANGSAYSDRLAEWDFKKFNDLRAKHFGEDRNMIGDPNKLEAFLRDYNDTPDLELLEIQEHCNWSNGYPVWLYIYRYDQEAAQKRWDAKRREPQRERSDG